MGNCVAVTTRDESAVGTVGVTGDRSRRPRRASRLRGWLFVAPALFAAAALAGCASGQPEKAAALNTFSATGPTLATIGQKGASIKPKPSTSPRQAHTAAAKRSTVSPVPTSAIPDGGPVCVTSTQKGTCGPYNYPAMEGAGQDPIVGNDIWSPISGWQQTLYSTNPGDWSVTVSGPAGNTAVVSYPNTGAEYGEKPLSSFHSITSSFTESMPHNASTSGWARL